MTAAARIFVVVAAAGSGTRFGGGLPKQYVKVHGLPLIVHALAQLARLDATRTVVAIARDDRDWLPGYARDASVIAERCGGATRAATVRNALACLADDCGADDYVAVHDAARALTPADALARLRDELRDDPVGGLLALPVADTLKRDDGSEPLRVSATEDRRGLWQAQTPQMFRYAKLAAALALPANADCTDEAQAMERAGHRPRLVRGSPFNFKITLADDLPLAAAILAAQNA